MKGGTCFHWLVRVHYPGLGKLAVAFAVVDVAPPAVGAGVAQFGKPVVGVDVALPAAVLDNTRRRSFGTHNFVGDTVADTRYQYTEYLHRYRRHCYQRRNKWW